MELDLPAGYYCRRLTMADSGAVFKLMARGQQLDIGSVEIEEADIIADWQRPGYSVEGSAIGVFWDDQLVGYAEHTGHDRSDAEVDPAHRGRGIGTALAGWVQALCRERGLSVVGQPVPVNSPADKLLAALGYHVRWTSWVLQLPPNAEVTPRALPAGYSVGEVPVADLPELHTVIEDAFLEWSERPRESIGDFEAQTVRRPGFRPWLLRAVRNEVDEIVAGAVLVSAPPAEVFVDRLATRRDQRHQGLAQALLADCFRVGAQHGAQVCSLSTDSRTGALDLYRKVGMRVTSEWVNRAINLRE